MSGNLCYQHYREKIVGGIYDDRLLVKPVKSAVSLMPNAIYELPYDGFDGFHFHRLRHTYTSNLLSNVAALKDVQELLGHSDVSTTMNIYAHSTRKAKRDSARLLDKVASNA
mgnify:CR=1 FL=1